MKDFFKDMQAKKDCEKAAERTWKTSMKELLVYIESIIPDEEVKKSWFTVEVRTLVTLVTGWIRLTDVK